MDSCCVLKLFRRKTFGILTLVAPVILLLSGCGKTKQAGNDAAEPAVTGTTGKEQNGETAPSAPILVPSTEKFGRIAMVNPSARFVVLSFPIGEVAVPGQQLNVYRNGLKVGELRVTGPQRENNTVADIVAGNPQAQDEVREN